jgi:hypothetical protein
VRVAFFVWLSALDKILTFDNLKKWHMILVNWHCLCKKSGETVDHLSLHCELASASWNSTFSLFFHASSNDRSLRLLEREVWQLSK